jgi:hypothetical protein
MSSAARRCQPRKAAAEEHVRAKNPPAPAAGAKFIDRTNSRGLFRPELAVHPVILLLDRWRPAVSDSVELTDDGFKIDVADTLAGQVGARGPAFQVVFFEDLELPGGVGKASSAANPFRTSCYPVKPL